MLNQGWKLVNSNHVEGKYSQSLLYSYNEQKESVSFYDNDLVEKRTVLTNDRLEKIEYFYDGNIRFIYGYNENDYRHGEWLEYNEDGNRLTRLTYDDGNLLSFWYGQDTDEYGSDHIPTLFSVDEDYFDLNNSQTEKLITPDSENGLYSDNGEQVKYLRSDSYLDTFGDVSFSHSSKIFTGNLCIYRGGIGGIGGRDFDPDNLNKIFRQLLLMKKYSSSSLFFFSLIDIEYGETRNRKNEFIGELESYGERRIKCPEPVLHLSLFNNELTITSFSNLEILSESTFDIWTDDEDCIKCLPRIVEFYQSNKPIIEYRNTLQESFTFNRFVWEHPVDYKQNYSSSFFDIGGELDFLKDGKRILSINNLLNVNLRTFENYFSQDKKVDWTIHTEGSIYKYGELHILCLSNDKEELKFERSKDNFFTSRHNKDISSNSKIIFKDKDDKVIHEDEYGRDGTGCPRVYLEDGSYSGTGLNDKSEYLIENIYQMMFGFNSMNDNGLFGKIFGWIFNPHIYIHNLWDFYDFYTKDGWRDDGNTMKSFDEFEFDIKVFLKKENFG